MEILVYREGEPRVASGFTVEQLPELLKEEKSVIWVDMPEPRMRVSFAGPLSFARRRNY